MSVCPLAVWRNCTPYGTHRLASVSFPYLSPLWWSDLLLHTLEKKKKSRSAFTDLTSSFLSDGGRRERLISSLSIFGSLVFIFFFFFDSIMFLFFSNPLGAASKRARGSCFKCWPCPFFYFGSLSLFLARSFGQRGGGGSWSARGHLNQNQIKEKSCFFLKKNIFFFSGGVQGMF